MKRPITLVFLLAAAVLCGNLSYNTYTVGIGWFLVKSQAAFEPTEVLYGEFLSPEDLFVRDGKLYVADSGNPDSRTGKKSLPGRMGGAEPAGNL